MVKGFFRMIELFLALTLLFTVIGTLQINNSPRYADPANTARLYDNAKRIALAYNAHRQDIINGNIAPIPSSMIPEDIDYHVTLYSTSSGHAIDSVVTELGNAIPLNKTLATHSLLVSGEIVNSTNRTYAPRRLLVVVWNK